ITSASKGMGTTNPTGYYDVGEVEDYEVLVDRVLPVDLISFDAKLNSDNSVKLDWITDNEKNIGSYEIERSDDGLNWSVLASINARNRDGQQQYTYTDNIPLNGKSYYRIRITNRVDGSTEKYSATKTVVIQSKTGIQIQPNPAVSSVTVMVDASKTAPATLRLVNTQGAVLEQRVISLKQGKTLLRLII
ncbi:MAG: hypothetical protein HC867_02585, partial [Bacteroidia bacterium]|nr:hypothetical protein [Bacteroidia bacterium]